MNRIHGFLKDFKGNKSSKRLAGLLLVIQGALMKAILFLYGLIWVTSTEFDKLNDCSMGLVYVGAGLLGWGIFEDKKITIGKK